MLKNTLKLIQLKSNKVKILLTMFFSVIYVFFIVALCRVIPIDSDKANHLLQAQDILSGNILFKDWNLTGVTFLTTDLFYYEIAEIIFGIGNRV